MDSICRELERRLRDFDATAGRRALMAWIDGLENVEVCIADGLRRASQSEDWLMFERYVIVAQRRPSKTYSKVLCDVLSRQGDEVNSEDIVDALAEIRDPSTIGCLEEAVWWQPPWDEFRNLSVKAVWALAAIGTSEAIAVLRDAASCEAAEVREAAAQKLRSAGL